MAYYVCKTEPGIYSYDDLLKQQEKDWKGVSNAAALQHLRQMQPGDRWIIYHVGEESVAVGTAMVLSVNTSNPAAPVVRVAAGERLNAPKTLDDILDEVLFDDSPLVTVGRQSVVPLTHEQWEWFLNKK